MLLQSALVWSVGLVVGPALLIGVERARGLGRVDVLHQPVAAGCVFLVCSIVNLTTGFVLAVRGRGTPLPLACPRELVVAGPYRYVRNPMAIAGVGQGIAVALWFGSALTLLYAVSGAFVWHVLVRPSEEADLRARFGKAYEIYKAAVPLWWPRMRAISIPS
jgi:protein-S-isoprenylcysteine O-methyltransferase Ste14